MKMIKATLLNSATGLVCLGALATLLTGCGTTQSAATKEKPPLERGWLGGQFREAKSFPKSVADRQPEGVLVGQLRTNTPAAVAGLREGDLILELNHQPVAKLTDFRRTIDQTAPGALLAVTASRDGQMADYQVPVGREKFRNGGNFAIGLPSFAHGWQLWPTKSRPGLSVVFAGYSVNAGHREELAPRQKEAYDEHWKVWLAIMELSKGQRVVAQEMVEERK
jgi:membrane-associated protease RseP (regulator of RpoE activity)